MLSARFITGIWHYARSLAYIRSGDATAAAKELAALQELREQPGLAELGLAGGVATAQQLLEIAALHVEGEFGGAAGNPTGASRAIGRAVKLQDALPYMEPPPWFFPTRQALGAILLHFGAFADAEKVYRKDLEQYPKNGWSLLGLSRSLERQGRVDDAAIVWKGFENAWSKADVTLTASRF